MKSIYACAMALAITACAAPRGPYDPMAAQCEYESNIATQSIRNPFLAGARQAEIYQQCLAIKRASRSGG